MKTPKIVIVYGAFAAISTIANLATQRLVLKTVSLEYKFWLAIFAGTAVGLVLKFVLDQRWIFYDTQGGAAKQAKKFTLYTLTGVGTTLVFWATETGFWLVWQTDLMREAGAVLGLTVGYIVKYNLDSRYVFSNEFSHRKS